MKNNLATDAATFGRAFELFDGQIRWHGDDPAPSLAEATLPRAHNSDRRRLRHAAAVWLEEALAAGPLASKELYRQGVERERVARLRQNAGKLWRRFALLRRNAKRKMQNAK